METIIEKLKNIKEAKINLRVEEARLVRMLKQGLQVSDKLNAVRAKKFKIIKEELRLIRIAKQNHLHLGKSPVRSSTTMAHLVDI